MAVSHARDEGLIKKRNILKMDRKINDSVRKYLDSYGFRFRSTLPEQVAQGSRWTLPMPFSEKDKETSSNEQQRWAQLPEDIREEARTQLHSFLLLKSDDIPLGFSYFSPVPLTLDNSSLCGPNLIPKVKKI